MGNMSRCWAIGCIFYRSKAEKVSRHEGMRIPSWAVLGNKGGDGLYKPMKFPRIRIWHTKVTLVIRKLLISAK